VKTAEPLSLIIFCAVSGMLALLTYAAWGVAISNVKPLLDTQGKIVQAEDGNIVWHGGRFYKMGMSYGLCQEPAGSNGCANNSVGACGFRLDHNMSLYASDTLESGTWELVTNNILPVGLRPAGIYFAPKVKWHAVKQTWVLWVNYLYDPAKYKFARSQYLTATSRTLAGPFVTQNTNVSVLQLPGGDFDIFTEGADAFLIYTSHLTEPAGVKNHRISVEKLSDDWLDSARLSSGYFGHDFVEAPVMFKRAGTYYALFDHCCCFCGEGSGAIVHTATHPLGPWTTHNQIGAYPNGTSVSMAQQRSTFWYQRGKAMVDGFDEEEGAPPPTLVWMGNRWQSSPDGEKDHDFETWLPVEFDGSNPPLPKPMVWQDSWSL
jgi:hypothetical protein